MPNEFSLEFNSINGLVSTIVIRLIDTHTKYAMNNVKLAQPADVALALVFFATLIIQQDLYMDGKMHSDNNGYGKWHLP